MMWKIQQTMQDIADFIRTIHPAFIPVTGLKCSYGKFSARLPRSRLEKPRSREPSQPTLSYEHIENFYKGFRGKARSRKPTKIVYKSRPNLCTTKLSFSVFQRALGAITKIILVYRCVATKEHELTCLP